MRKEERKIWLPAPLCIFWAVWKERNMLVFENDDFLLQRLKSSFVVSLHTWASLCVNPESLFVGEFG